jgi:hypothetical protein
VEERITSTMALQNTLLNKKHRGQWQKLSKVAFSNQWYLIKGTT